jgi:predicted RNA-binding Zn ribbon-like protein
MEAALQSGRGTLISPSAAQAGDIVIEGNDGHVGICMNDGCTQVLSNSSSKASFSWVSGTNFSGTGGTSRVYQLNH